MSRALEIQILVYMVIVSIISIMYGYVKGHRDGLQLGRNATHKLYLNLPPARLPEGHKPVNTVTRITP